MQRLREHAPLVFLGALCIVTAFIWQSAFAKTPGKLTVAFLNVGQGDSIYIEGPDGTQLLVDGGPDRTVLSRLGSIMPLADRSIDVVIATHPDQDHISGLVDVLSLYDVHYVFEPGIGKDTNAYKALEHVVAEKQIPRILARRGMRIPLGGGAEFRILFPDRDIESDDTNDDSIVAEVRYGKTCFLLTGDAPTKTVESYILYVLKDEHLRCDVLKLGHHGSSGSSGIAFLSAVSPAAAVVSAGKGNRYGHPAPDVLARVASLDIPLLSTIDEGTIVFESDGKVIRER